MDNKKCTKKPKTIVWGDGLRRTQLCTQHLADKHVQHLIGIGILMTKRIDGLEGECNAEIAERAKKEGAPLGEVVV